MSYIIIDKVGKVIDEKQVEKEMCEYVGDENIYEHCWQIATKMMMTHFCVTPFLIEDLKENDVVKNVLEKFFVNKYRIVRTCKTCGKKTTINARLCNNCWEVENRIGEYLKSEKGRAYIMELLKI